MTDTLKIIPPHDLDVASQVALALARTASRGAAGLAAGFMRVGYIKARTPLGAVLAASSASAADAADAARHMDAGWAVNAATLDRLDTVLHALEQWSAAGASVPGSDFSNALAGCRVRVAAELAELALAEAHARRDAVRLAEAATALSAHGITVDVHANNLMTVTHRDGTREVRQTLGQVEQLAAFLVDNSEVIS
jgi:hypothetical protein